MFAKDKVSQSMIDAVNSVLMEKKMHDVELDETGLRKAAYAAHKAGQSHFDFQGKKYPVKVQGEEVMAGDSIDEASVKVPTKTGTIVYGGAKGGSAKAYLQQKYGDDLADVHGPSDKDLKAIKHEKKKKKEVDEEVEELDEDKLALRGLYAPGAPMNDKRGGTGAYSYGVKPRQKTIDKRSQELKDVIKDTLGKHGPKGKLPEEVESLDEVLSKDADAAAWIHDFVHSDNPKFKGKSTKERQQMALGAYYAKQRNEEVELKEGYEEIKVHSKDGKHIGTITHGKYQSVAYAHPTTKFGGSKEPHPDEDSTELKGPHDTQSGIDFIHAHHRMMNESFESLEELSKKLLGSYAKKSSGDASKRQSDVTGHNKFQHGARTMAGAVYGDKVQSYPDRKDPKIAKRQAGLNKAVDRLTKEENTSFAYRLLQSIKEGKGNQPQETFTDNNIGEAGVDTSVTTTDTLAGRKPGGKLNQHGPDPKIKLKSEEKEEGHEDEKEDKKLIKKMVKSDCVKEEDVTEAMDTRADVPAFLRKKRGDKPLTPDEVKEKKPDTRSAPGNVKEAEEKEPPFAGPYTKAKGTVTDKSGAKHTPMSRVKDLARKALTKVKTETLMGTAGATSESVEELDELNDKTVASYISKRMTGVLGGEYKRGQKDQEAKSRTGGFNPFDAKKYKEKEGLKRAVGRLAKEEVEDLDEDAMLDVYLKSRGLNPATITTDKKIAYAKGSDFLRWKQNHS